jgi:hypothetical protein
MCRAPIASTCLWHGYMYHHNINNQALLMRIEHMQEELTRLHKTIAEKDELIALLLSYPLITNFINP